MIAESKTLLLATQLIRETVNGLVKWKIKEPPRALIEATERVVPLYLETEYKGKLLGVYDIRSKSFYDEHAFYWSESIGLCVVDNQGRVLWESDEYTQALLDLYNIAREQVSGVNNILDDLLE